MKHNVIAYYIQILYVVNSNFELKLNRIYGLAFKRL